MLSKKKHKRPEASIPITFDYKVFDDYYKDFVLYFETNSLEDDWQNFFVKHLDYISHPSIMKKNSLILENFVQTELPELMKASEEEFEDIQAKIKILLDDSYNLKFSKTQKEF